MTAVSEPDAREAYTALHLACRTTLAGCDAKAIMLLDRSANPSLQTKDGWTPLMFACLQADAEGKVATVNALLECHADPDLQNSDGSTALILTLKDKKPFSVSQMLIAAMLVGAGADVKRKDHEGYSALDDCSQIAGEAIGGKGDEDEESSAQIFATMIHRGVYFSGVGGEVDGIVRSQAQRGFILPDFDLEEMRQSGMNVGTVSEDGRAKISVILRAYCGMDPVEIARCAMQVFVHEGLFVALMKGMWLSHLASTEARRVQAVDENHAAALTSLSDRIQLSVAGLFGVTLDSSADNQHSVEQFLEVYQEGETVLVAASKYQMKAVLAHPEIQRFTERLWWGWLYQELVSKGAPKLIVNLAVVATLAVQLLLSPFVGLFPFLGRATDRRLRWLSHRVFGVPVIDFWSSSLCHIVFLLLLIGNPTLSNQHYAVRWGLVVWAISDLWSELLELTDGFSLESIQKELFALVNENYRSEYTIDPFNIFDLLSCTFNSIALVWFAVLDTIDEAQPAEAEGGLGRALLIKTQQTAAGGGGGPDLLRNEESRRVPSGLLALGVFFGWLRALRVLSMSEKMGPFVLMFLQMLYAGWPFELRLDMRLDL